METNKKRILSVEDHSANFELAATLLSDYQVVRAANLFGGVELALDEYFECYLSDDQLGNGTGLDFCRQVRTFDPVTPILICSANRLTKKLRCLRRAEGTWFALAHQRKINTRAGRGQRGVS